MAYSSPGESREAVYQLVRRRLLAQDPPSVREIQAAMGYRAVESARRQLDALVQEGRLRKLEGQARGYRLPLKAKGDRAEALELPLLGQVAAGPLSAAIELAEGSLRAELPGEASDYFALRVSGESMIDAGILPGDILIVHRESEIPSGEIVVARVGEEATVKRLLRRGRRIELLAENPRIANIVPPLAELELLGRVVELRRSL